jgi:hypothetical protein
MGKYDHSKFVIISFMDTAPIAIETNHARWTTAPLIRTCGMLPFAIAFIFHVLPPIKIN